MQITIALPEIIGGAKLADGNDSIALLNLPRYLPTSCLADSS